MSREEVETIQSYKIKAYKNKPMLIMMIGLPASGKSTVANSLLVLRDNEEHKPNIHSSDELRKKLFNNVNDTKHNNTLFDKLHKNIINDLKSGKDVIYDATNISKKTRVGFLNSISKIPCEKVCMCMLTPYRICLKRNEKRTKKVPQNVIKRMYENFSPPMMCEGFDDIVLAYNYDDYNKEKYSLKSFFITDVGAMHISQENKHHTLTIGNHCVAAYDYIDKNGYDDISLRFAALLHDCGKPFTKTKYNARGEMDGDCHYYNHEKVGAYDSFFFTDLYEIPQYKRVEIANLIYYHMRPFTAWRSSEKAKERDRKLVGDEFFEKINIIHEADMAAK